MKQILQNLKTGSIELAEIPCPKLNSGQLLIRTRTSLISTGTERMLLDFGKANILDKARQQPDKIREVLDKIRTDGLVPTLTAVQNKLDQPLPLGYCNAGEVVAVGSGVHGFAIGDRVVSNGPHAEIVRVPKNLCAHIPDGVDNESAPFVVLASIGLQGIRLAQPTLGEAFVVTGVGLIGLLTVRLLRAQGCRVLAIDFDDSNLAMARRFGAETCNPGQSEDPVAAGMAFSRTHGVDGVIITASTKSSDPVTQAARMCRKRGRIVLVGVTGLKLNRSDFYEKELTFQVSCSYGPGRYDQNYEEKGQDYPVGLVRWTEQRNFEAALDMMTSGALDVKPLISHRFDIAEAEKAYELIGSAEPSLGILLNYPGIETSKSTRTVSLNTHVTKKTAKPSVLAHNARISFLGSGNYATSVLIPAFKAAGADLRSVASSKGVSGVHAGRKFSFTETTTDGDQLFADAKVDAVVITTRHDSHARYVLQGLKSRKHVFVEKPLCLTLYELGEIEEAYGFLQALTPKEKNVRKPTVATGKADQQSILMVGFNRRFAPQVQKMKNLLNGVSGPKSMVITVNAGKVPAEHWTQDFEMGGGRIIGEACHFIDLLRFLAGVPIISYQRMTMDTENQDTVTLQLSFANGSIGTVHYFANGSKSFPKERIEVFASGGVLQLDNYRKLTGFGWPGFRNFNLFRQDKGQKACAKAFVDAISQGANSPIPIDEIIEVSRVSIELANAP